jgi:hypothetical protein
MLRKTTLLATAFALVAAQTAPSFAQEWRRIYAPDDSALAGVMGEKDVAGMAYLKIPFGGPAHLRKDDVKYGVTLAARAPDSVTTSYVETQRNLMSLADLKFTPDGFDDLRISGLSARQAYYQLAYRSEGEPSGWWTYGLMALALGIGAVIIVTASSDGFTEETAPATAGN